MFKLQRYFSLTSLIAFIAVTVALGYIYSWSATQNLLNSAEEHHEALTQIFANSLWVEYADFIQHSKDMSGDAIRARPEIAALYTTVAAQTEGTSAVKIKIYNNDALTIFSTELAQIGDDKSNNSGFLAARAGNTVSELTHRDTFSAFEQTIEDRDVLSSYVPIRQSGHSSDSIEGVFEIYSDITPLLDNIARTRRQLVSTVAVLLTALYLILFAIVRYADQILRRQAAERETVREELKRERATLADRVTEQTAELREVNQRLLQSGRLKDQFLAMISHELRTPLTTILSRSDALSQGVYGALEHKQQRVVDGLQTSGQHLLGLVNDLLDVSRIQNRSIALENSTVDVESLCRTSIEQVHGLIRRKRLNVSYRRSPSAETIYGDERRLRQILINLLNNAAKFTPDSGKIGLDVSLSNGHNLLVFSVWDHGIGISEANQAHIFKPFTQVDSRLAREFDGVGLGLALVKQLAELHGGRIQLKSELGRGSIFRVILPITQPEINRMSAEPVASLA